MKKTAKKKAARKVVAPVEAPVVKESLTTEKRARSLRFGYHSAPPGGWWFLEERTGLRIEEETFERLVDKLIEHRRYKGLEPTALPKVWREVEQTICERVPKPYWRQQ